MWKRSLVLIAATIAIASGVSGEDRTPAAQPAENASANAPRETARTAPLTLSAIAAASDAATVTESGMIIVKMPMRHVLVARIGSDRGRKTSCVSNEAAARSILARSRTIDAPASPEK